MKQYQIPNSFFVDKRKQLIDRIEKDALVILFSNDQKLRTGDQYYPYRQDSDLFYLTGIEQEETILVLEQNKEILFLLVPDQKMEVYDDEKLSFEEAQVISGIENVLPLTEFENYLENILSKITKVYTTFSQKDNLTSLSDRNQGQSIAKKLFQQYSSIIYCQIFPLISELRLRKQPIEIESLQKACDITDDVFRETVRAVRPGVYEYEIDAKLKYEFAKRGIKALSFEPIIASGENALRLHYTKKDSRCNDGDLLLFDIGCEYSNYCSDCSRTIPVNGKFTERQKECYNAVRNVYEQAKKLFIKGNTILEINIVASELMANELLKLGLITRDQYNDDEQRKLITKKYLPHGISHFVGLDTHDVGASNVVLEKGMVLTCEPGIYIPEENIGIRIETMLLITDNEPYDFFSDIPLTIKEIERMFS